MEINLEDLKKEMIWLQDIANIEDKKRGTHTRALIALRSYLEWEREREEKQKNINYKNIYSELSLHFHMKWDMKKLSHSLLKAMRTIQRYSSYSFKSVKIEKKQDWIKSNKKTYNAFISSRIHLMNEDFLYIYSVDYTDKEYKQLNKKYFYSNDFLSVNQHYKIGFEIQTINCHKVTRNVVVSANIQDSSNLKHFGPENYSYLNDVQKKHNLSLLDILKFNLWTPSDLSIFRDNDKAHAIKKILSLKFSKFNPKMKEDDFIHSPLHYEWWTKNPKNASISFYEKKSLSEITDQYLVGQKNEYNGEIAHLFYDYKGITFNEEIWNKLNTEKNNDFIDKYDEYKIYKENSNLLLGKHKRLLDSIKKINSIKIHVNKLEVPSELNYDQKCAFETIIRNSFSILYGHAGTGKTRLISHVVNSLNEMGETYILLAPTHRALAVSEEFAKVLKNSENVISSTVQQKNEEKKNMIIF